MAVNRTFGGWVVIGDCGGGVGGWVFFFTSFCLRLFCFVVAFGWKTICSFSSRKGNTAHPSPQIPVARADPFHATVVPTIENSSSLWPECTDRQQEKEEAAVMKEEGCEDKQEIEDTLIVQSDLVVIPHSLPTAADAVSVLPVFVDSKGIVYAQDAGEGDALVHILE